MAVRVITEDIPEERRENAITALINNIESLDGITNVVLDGWIHEKRNTQLVAFIDVENTTFPIMGPKRYNLAPNLRSLSQRLRHTLETATDDTLLSMHRVESPKKKENGHERDYYIIHVDYM